MRQRLERISLQSDAARPLAAHTCELCSGLTLPGHQALLFDCGAPALDLSETCPARFAGRDLGEIGLPERCRRAYATHRAIHTPVPNPPAVRTVVASPMCPAE